MHEVESEPVDSKFVLEQLLVLTDSDIHGLGKVLA
jgi:hypothetical protein